MVIGVRLPSLEGTAPYPAERNSARWRTVKSSDRERIQLLLAFCMLDRQQQDVFLEAVNAYLFASPRQRERLRRAWTLHDRDADAEQAPDVGRTTQIRPVR